MSRSLRPVRPLALALALLGLVPIAAQTPAPGPSRAAVAPPPATTAVNPEMLGLSRERLARIDAVVDEQVAARHIAGGVALVMRNGRVVHLKAYGKQDVERGVPMASDTLFRIASMSKAITTVAAMTLIEEGRLLLTDPVSKYLPSFRQTFVAVPPPADAPAGTRTGTVPAKRPVTIRDLMTHTAGISYGDGPLEREYREAGAYSWYCADRDEPVGALIDRLASLPFSSQPGERWVYGFGTDVLGRVIEVVAGQPLDEALRTRVFDPLRMRDTFFYVPREKSARLATVYSAQADGTIARAPDAGREGQGAYVEGPRKCFAGGAGLVSTITDYGRFLQMLLDGGVLDGARVLSPASVASMTANQVGTLYQNGDLGFGLGFEIVEQLGRAGRLGAVGEYSWGSAYYPRFWVDPADGVVAIFMTQLIPAGSLDLTQKFRSLVYQSIVVQGKVPGGEATGRTAGR